jgi:kynurenine formamidase
MPWHFLSYELSDSLSGYAGGDRIKIKQSRSMCCGDTSNNTEFWMPTHYGTHIDYPFHFSKEGRTGSSYQAKDFVFKNVKVINLDLRERENKLILPEDINEANDDSIDALIINTSYSSLRFQDKYWNDGPGFAVETASKLKEIFKNLKIIGFDSISLTNFNNRPLGRVAHKAFLIENDLIILEDMKLDEISSMGKIKQLIVAPLRMINADGAPVTVMAETDHD